MNKDLFQKYSKALQNNTTKKIELLTHLNNKTGVVLNESEVIIRAQKVDLLCSSVKKAALISHGVDIALLEKGYTRTR